MWSFRSNVRICKSQNNHSFFYFLNIRCVVVVAVVVVLKLLQCFGFLCLFLNEICLQSLLCGLHTSISYTNILDSPVCSVIFNALITLESTAGLRFVASVFICNERVRKDKTKTPYKDQKNLSKILTHIKPNYDPRQAE